MAGSFLIRVIDDATLAAVIRRHTPGLAFNFALRHGARRSRRSSSRVYLPASPFAVTAKIAEIGPFAKMAGWRFIRLSCRAMREGDKRIESIQGEAPQFTDEQLPDEQRNRMPNIGALLKQEIGRLSRREIRGQVQATKKASAQYRRHIAGLRRQVAALERQVALLQRRVANGSAASSTESAPRKVRFVAKGLKAQRARLGLSAAEYAKLVGVSPQSIYNWEQGHTSPRAEQLAVVAKLRGIGKREAHAHLEELGAKRASRGAKRGAKH
jgi:DNA-binding XRE family transcriptional regulator